MTVSAVLTVLLRLTFPRAKLRRQIFLTGRIRGRRIGRKIGRNFGRNFLGIVVLRSLYRTTHQTFSPNCSQFITPCLVTAPVTEISKFHLRELLGLGVPKFWRFWKALGWHTTPLFFLEKARKPTQKTRIFYPYRTPRMSGKEGRNGQKGIPGSGKKQGAPPKTRKGRTGSGGTSAERSWHE